MYGRTMVVKSLDISKIVYGAFMLSVPETVVKTVRDRIFKFLWKNKKDKVKRAVIYQPLSHGGVNFPDIPTVVESLSLSWLGRFLKFKFKFIYSHLFSFNTAIKNKQRSKRTELTIQLS